MRMDRIRVSLVGSKKGVAATRAFQMWAESAAEYGSGRLGGLNLFTLQRVWSHLSHCLNNHDLNLVRNTRLNNSRSSSEDALELPQPSFL